MTQTPTRENIVPFLADIVARRGAESYIGEAVTMEAHMLQCAALAEAEGAPDALVAAALLHDIGHYLSEFGAEAADEGVDNLHEEAGAAVLADYFPPVVVDCVKLHVPAKRYLCAVDPGYHASLSEASKLSLELQGGKMSAEEVAEFEAHPHYSEAARLRIWDDKAKIPGRATPNFDHYAPLLQRVVEARAPH